MRVYRQLRLVVHRIRPQKLYFLKLSSKVAISDFRKLCKSPKFGSSLQPTSSALGKISAADF